MKGRNVIDIIERFQTHHALQEEREMKNFRASANGALAPDVPDENGMPQDSRNGRSGNRGAAFAEPVNKMIQKYKNKGKSKS